jgi:hypothetical protein
MAAMSLAYQCFRNEGNDFIIIRGYCSFGGLDPNGLNSFVYTHNSACIIVCRIRLKEENVVIFGVDEENDW